MASTTATYYRSGVQQTGGYVGTLGYDGGPVVGRFAFTTPNTGASSFSFSSSTLGPVTPTTWSSGDPTAFRWAITENASVNIGKIGTDGYATGVDWGEPNHLTSNGSKTVQLLPNKTYYLWIYPTVAQYNRWAIGSIIVSFGGVYGTPSTFTATNPGTFGSAVTITLSRNLSSALHTVKVTCLGHTETILTKGSTYPTLTWTPAVATYAPLLVNAKSTTATITVETFYSGYSVGSKSVSITMRFSDADVKPSITLAVSDPTGNATTYGAYVATKSKYTATITPAYQYGATLGSVSIIANGASYSTNPATTDEIVSVDNNKVIAQIVDSRGVSSDQVSTVLSVLPYSAPQIASFSIHRCNQDGTSNDQGAYCRVDYSVEISPLGNHNSKALVVKYKKRNASTYTDQPVALTGYTQTSYAVIPADTNATYDVQLALTDDFSTTSSELQLSTAFATVNFKAGGDGIAIGKVAEYSRMLELADGWTLGVDGVDKLAQLDDLEDEVHTDYALKSELPGFTIGYVDDASARSNITLSSGGYARITPPTLPTGAIVFAVAAIKWTSSNGISIIPYYDYNDNSAYVIGAGGITVTGLQCRWWYYMEV